MELSIGLVLVVVLAGFAVGYFSAMFGVGGGVIMVPFMVLVVGLTQHAAEGTSLLVIIPTAIAGVDVHLRKGFVSPARALPHGGRRCSRGDARSEPGASYRGGLPDQDVRCLHHPLRGPHGLFQGWKLRRAPG